MKLARPKVVKNKIIMAGATSVVASGTFNALAFTGFSFLFRMLDNDNYLKEVKRHNLALEQLQLAKEQWYQNEVAKKEEILKLRQELKDADKDIARTNAALKQLAKVRTLKYRSEDGSINKKFTREPHLYDFYTPSKEMKQYAVVTTGMVSGVAGWGLYKFLG